VKEIKETYENLTEQLNLMAKDNLSFFHQEFLQMHESMREEEKK
jgi:hypothetical protein